MPGMWQRNWSESNAGWFPLPLLQTIHLCKPGKEERQEKGAFAGRGRLGRRIKADARALKSGGRTRWMLCVEP